MYVSILQFHHYVFPSYLSSFQYLGILLWISHIPARRDRRMIKLICRMPSCMNYMLASLYVASIDYVLLFLCTMRFVWTMHSFVSLNYEVCMDYALICLYGLYTSWFVYMCKFMCFMQFMGKICKHVYFLGNPICKIVHVCVIYLI